MVRELKKLTLINLLLFAVSIFSCTPKVQHCIVPKFLKYGNIPKDFTGTLYVAGFKIPFKYKVKQNRMLFPLTYVGFVSYKGTTLKLAKYKIDFFLPLWRVLKHRLVTSMCKKTVYRCFTYIESETERGVKIYLTLDSRNRPLKGKICSMGTCYDVLYKGNEVLIKMEPINLKFVLSLSQ